MVSFQYVHRIKKAAGGHAGNNSTAKPETTNGRYQPYPTSKPVQQEDTPAATPTVTESETATPETTVAAPAAPAIHPSRTALLNGGAVNSRREKPGRSAFPNLHPGSNYPPPKPYGRNAGRQQMSTKVYATGMNGVGGEAPMRSWGGSPAPEEGEDAVNGSVNGMVQEASTSMPMMVDVEKKKKKKKKGDKGGTGSRANSSAAKRATTAEPEVPASTESTNQDGDAVKATAEAPAVIIPATPMASEAQHTRPEGDSKKKRKADAEADEDTTMTNGDASSSSSSSSKTAKKLRKALQSIATSSKQTSSSSVTLATLIEKITGEMSKKKKSSDGVIDATGITRDIKVKFVEGSNGQEGQWVLEV
ncbi:hypothetical protein QFC22_005620 [Naganishia vaughanmartiniae]|uniref:Uncharacterized protein n=1 Tax=Naganishia vaughanmartiniae TaxID=1424756 RepID=A0ACC2WSK2_9TREE|nr:hypothetical protein QFC22_005620 [Naganishia vaughanmartiniae]